MQLDCEALLQAGDKRLASLQSVEIEGRADRRYDGWKTPDSNAEQRDRPEKKRMSPYGYALAT
jgi:hypothetical protein